MASSHMPPGCCGSHMLGGPSVTSADVTSQINSALTAYTTTAALNTLLNAKASRTTGVTHIYADGSTGSDANDGLTSATPVRTLDTAYNLIPDIIFHFVILHLSGTFDSYPLVASARTLRLTKVIASGVRILIDGTVGASGASGLTSVAGPFTSTSATAALLTDTTQTWTVDAYQGYWVKMTSGAANGFMAAIQGNTATTLTPIANISPAPSAGDTFEVVKPTTVIMGDSGGAASNFIISCLGAGSVTIQRIRFNQATITVTFNGVISLLGCMFENCASWTHIGANYGTYASGGSWFDPADGSSTGSGATFSGGATWLTTATVTWRSLSVVSIGRATAKGIVTAVQLTGLTINNGTRFNNQVQLIDVARTGVATNVISDSASSPVTLFDSSTTAPANLRVLDCPGICIGGGTFTAGLAGSSGIEVLHSLVRFTSSTPTGTSSRVGVYLHAGSAVQIASGSPPALTGTLSGDFSFDNTTTGGTWASVSGGSPVFSTAGFALVEAI